MIDLCCGMRGRIKFSGDRHRESRDAHSKGGEPVTTKSRLHASMRLKWHYVTGKEGVLLDLVSSGGFLSGAMYAVLIVVLFYTLYDEMAVSLLFSLFRVNLKPYMWFVLTMMAASIFSDYMTTQVTEDLDESRHRMRHLHRIAPNGFLWQRDIFSTAIDLRIDDSLRSLDTLSFTLQYYYGTLMVSTGVVLGYLFLFSYLSDADSSSSQSLLTSIIAPFIDPIAVLLAITSRLLLAFVWPVVEKMIVNGLVDARSEEIGRGKETLNARMRNKYRIMCEQAMREHWTQQQFIEQIKSATNELIANELKASQNPNSDLAGIDNEDVKDVIAGDDNAGGPQRTKKEPLPFKVQALLSRSTRVGFDDNEVNTALYELPPEMDNPKRRMQWRARI